MGCEGMEKVLRAGAVRRAKVCRPVVQGKEAVRVKG